jgi:cyclic pyranopterin phosphate synthase
VTKRTPLTHVNEDGEAEMVDVGHKDITRRVAVATATVTMAQETAEAIRQATLKKGDALTTARLAGIMAAKRTDELIPLCHGLPLDHVQVDLHVKDTAVVITASAATQARTGIEMEALTAASVAALTIYDMAKAIDRDMTITEVRLLEKRGGSSGDWKATR